MNSPPSTLGQYQIIREIARSNDIVYEAYDPLMNRRVAIKELAMPQGVTGPQQEERINRFKREAQAAGTLNHSNIMTVYQIAEDAGRTFMAMEYLDGGTLRNEIDTKGYLSVNRAVEIITEVLDGLGHAHSKGVIHRDIKPDNIQILSNGTIKITDFGIARLTFQPNLTMDGQVFGTPSYMSPEQVVGKEIDQRSDLFSVGVVLYEMISGQKPFAGDSVVSITYAIMNTEPSKPPQADYALWQVILKALDKSLQLRYANAGEMIQAIKDARSALQSGIAGAVTGPTPVSYGANPYLPPVVQSAPAPVYTFNPYMQQAAPPPQGAYQTTPYQASGYQASPYPAQYQTTPYQAGQYGYQAGPSMAPPSAYPIYYPPPARAPLINAETASFLKRMCLTFLLLGTLTALLIVGLNAIADSVRNARNDAKDDNRLPNDLANLPRNMSLTDKVQRGSEDLGKDLSDGSKATIKNWIATQYHDTGRQALQGGKLDVAEAAFTTGTQEDPGNPTLMSDLALVTQELAETRQGAEQRQMQLESGDEWANAYGLEGQAQQKQEDARGAAEMYLKYANSACQTGDRSEMETARRRLYNARDMVGQDEALDAQIKQTLQQLS